MSVIMMQNAAPPRKHPLDGSPDVPASFAKMALESADRGDVLVAIAAQLGELERIGTRLRQLATVLVDQLITDQVCALEAVRGSLAHVVRARVLDLREQRAIAAESIEPPPVSLNAVNATDGFWDPDGDDDGVVILLAGPPLPNRSQEL